MRCRYRNHDLIERTVILTIGIGSPPCVIRSEECVDLHACSHVEPGRQRERKVDHSRDADITYSRFRWLDLRVVDSDEASIPGRDQAGVQPFVQQWNYAFVSNREELGAVIEAAIVMLPCVSSTTRAATLIEYHDLSTRGL